MFIHMITASLLRRRSRMLVALLAIAIGATILSGLLTIYIEVPKQMGAEFRNYGANMIVTAEESSFTSDDLEAAKSVFKDGELVGATPFRYETVRMHEQPILAAGTDMENLQKTSPYWLIDGEWPEGSGELIVGQNIAETLGLKAGDSVTVTFRPSEDAETDNALDFVVKGTLSTGGSEENYVYMPMEDMETLTETTDAIGLAELSVSATSDELTSYMNTINEKVPAVSAKLVKRVTASEATVLSKLQALILLVTIIVLALTMITVATTMTAVVSERRNEIGLRKAIGASDGSILAEFMGEGILLGAVGGIVGSILGFLFAQFVSMNVFSSQISLRPLLIPITLLASVAVTAAACFMPVRSATKIDPALVLKGE